mmetsp:Transcript_20330/g.58773  ORF Transcript_20330/g.58773 Transcript_20330/m.58773 type:complete len:245 (-) Transcript_20330:2239-2973(-)
MKKIAATSSICSDGTTHLPSRVLLARDPRSPRHDPSGAVPGGSSQSLLIVLDAALTVEVDGVDAALAVVLLRIANINPSAPVPHDPRPVGRGVQPHGTLPLPRLKTVEFQPISHLPYQSNLQPLRERQSRLLILHRELTGTERLEGRILHFERIRGGEDGIGVHIVREEVALVQARFDGLGEDVPLLAGLLGRAFADQFPVPPHHALGQLPPLTAPPLRQSHPVGGPQFRVPYRQDDILIVPVR